MDNANFDSNKSGIISLTTKEKPYSDGIGENLKSILRDASSNSFIDASVVDEQDNTQSPEQIRAILDSHSQLINRPR